MTGFRSGERTFIWMGDLGDFPANVTSEWIETLSVGEMIERANELLREYPLPPTLNHSPPNRSCTDIE